MYHELPLSSMLPHMNEVEQIIKQLNRQIDVIRIRDITDQPHLEREVILIKVSAPAEKRAEIFGYYPTFPCNT